MGTSVYISYQGNMGTSVYISYTAIQEKDFIIYTV